MDLCPGSTRIETPSRPKAPPPATIKHSTNVRLNPDTLLPQEVRTQFRSLLDEYDSVFDPNITGYNVAAGPFEAKVNPHNARVDYPQYSRDKLVELQQKFDELEDLGVFKRPDDGYTRESSEAIESDKSIDIATESFRRLRVADETFLSPDTESTASTTHSNGTHQSKGEQLKLLNKFLVASDIAPVGKPWFDWSTSSESTRQRYTKRAAEIVSARYQFLQMTLQPFGKL
ncbi:hypothetical protein QZH41_003674 [Actinostola sp. cb2023]|nr:hypothetical protein QZH41_003674 [Actinostola sp. cb2023]